MLVVLPAAPRLRRLTAAIRCPFGCAPIASGSLARRPPWRLGMRAEPRGYRPPASLSAEYRLGRWPFRPFPIPLMRLAMLGIEARSSPVLLVLRLQSDDGTLPRPHGAYSLSSHIALILACPRIDAGS